MRSHSRADFYAKAIALMALGGIAGAGVVIDHWPSASRLPQIVFQPPQLRTPVVQTFEQIGALAYVSMEFRPVSQKPRLIAPRPMPRPRWAASFGRSIRKVQPAPAFLVPAEVLSIDMLLPMPVMELGQAPELTADLDETWQPLQAPVGTSAQAVEEGFISGAIRKTSASLDKAKTSLVDAFRAVGGAVRILKK